MNVFGGYTEISHCQSVHVSVCVTVCLGVGVCVCASVHPSFSVQGREEGIKSYFVTALVCAAT